MTLNDEHELNKKQWNEFFEFIQSTVKDHLERGIRHRDTTDTMKWVDSRIEELKCILHL